MANILFFTEDIDYPVKAKTALRRWITRATHAEGFRVGEINFILCSDNYLLNINREYLHHDTYTDIVTFENNHPTRRIIGGDIFISVDRIRENARKYNVPERDELHRVMIHGVLHLCGYSDKKKEEKAVMTAKEDHYLSRRLLTGL